MCRANANWRNCRAKIPGVPGKADGMLSDKKSKILMKNMGKLAIMVLQKKQDRKEGVMTTEEYLAARKSKNWKFNRVVDRAAFQNVNRIHPIKQRQVKDIVEAARDDQEVDRIIVFGSSTRYDCDMTSDLDICINWKRDCYDSEGVLKPFTGNMRRVISKVTQGRADVVNYDYLDSTVLGDAVKEGVVVYEHNI